jgi:glycosyltransferase involved in cell wall biosynthesis
MKGEEMNKRTNMKIGIIAPPFLPIVTDMNGYGGTERVIAELARCLALNGNEVTLFAPEGSSISAAVKLVSTGKPLWSNGSSNDYKLTEEEKRKGIQKTLDAAYDYADRIDIFHSHVDDSITDKRFDSLTSISTIHDYISAGGLRARYVEASSNRPIVFVSKSQSSFMPEANMVGVVYNGINPQSFIPSYETGKYLVFLGRVSPDKGMHVAMDVAHYAGIKLVAIYREPVNNPLDKNANADLEYYTNEIKPRFKSYGNSIEAVIDPPRMVRDEILRSAFALIGPSGFPPSTWSEPFGLFITEGMASGTPSIVYNKGGPAEIVVEGETGFIAKSRNPNIAMMQMVGALNKVREGGSEMRLRSRLRLEEHFSSEKMAEGYVKAYTTVLDGLLRKPAKQRVISGAQYR